MTYDGVITKPEMDDLIIEHYGVMGMKWGVRKDPSKAYDKSSNKADSLRRKSVSKAVRSASRTKRAQKKVYKATKSLNRTVNNPFSSQEDIGAKVKKLKRAERKAYRASKASAKAAKGSKRETQWINRMENVFADVKISQIHPEVLKKHRKYSYMLSQ